MNLTYSVAVSLLQDANNCTTPPHRASTLFPDSDLHYSYETCGFVETFGPRRLLEELAEFNNGNPIRVSFPGNDAYRLYRTKDGEITGSFHEVFIGVQELINAVKQEPVPFQMDVPITDAAKEFVRHEFGLDSSYTGAATGGTRPHCEDA